MVSCICLAGIALLRGPGVVGSGMTDVHKGMDAMEACAATFSEKSFSALTPRIAVAATGKCRLTQELGHRAVRTGPGALCTTQFLGQRTPRRVAAYERRFKALRVWNGDHRDLGLNPWFTHDEDLHDLVAERYERFTIIAG